MKKFTVTVILEGQVLKAVSDGTEKGTVFTGSDEHIRRVKKSIRLERLVDIVGTRHSPVIKSGYEDAFALTAALCSIIPRYTTIWTAPKEVLDFLKWNLEDNDHGLFTIEDIEED